MCNSMGINSRIVKPTIEAQDWQRDNCYGCGPANQHSLKAHFLFDETSGEVRFRHKMQGFEHGAPGYVHGGALATILDEAQGALCHHIGHSIMTEQLTIKYNKAVPIDAEFDVRCWVTTVRKRRMYTRATITSLEKEILVFSSASWYLLSERIAARLFKNTMTIEESEFIKEQLEVNRKRAKEIRKRIRIERDRH